MRVHLPAEWAPHQAIWVGYPSDPALWLDELPAARAEVQALVRALAGPGGERVRVLVSGVEAAASAHARFAGVAHVDVVHGAFGDVWLRDTGPLFGACDGRRGALAFRFNGWGGKYVLKDDHTVAEQMAAAAGVRRFDHGFLLEGGALDGDGFGTFLTTRQCLLRGARNVGWSEADAQAALRDAIGAHRLLWLDEGLANDHTDGHVDNLARFVAPGTVACPVAVGADDPNAAVYASTARTLAGLKDARGVALQVLRVPSPGLLRGADGEVLPASHMNFVIANNALIMPTFEDAAGGARASAMALEALQSMFPERQAIGLPARALLSGGGSFHCITQQEPV